VSVIKCILAEFTDAAGGADGEVEGEDNEHEQRQDLERQTREHDVITQTWVLILVHFYARDTAPGSLQNQGDDIAGNKYTRV
jgi:hypothetical protein